MREYLIRAADGAPINVPSESWDKVLCPVSFPSRVLSAHGEHENFRLHVSGCEAAFRMEPRGIRITFYECDSLQVEVTNGIVAEISENVEGFIKRKAEWIADEGVTRQSYMAWADPLFRIGCFLMFIDVFAVAFLLLLMIGTGQPALSAWNIFTLLASFFYVMGIAIGIQMKRKWAVVLLCLASLAGGAFIVWRAFSRSSFPLNMLSIPVVVFLNYPSLMALRYWSKLSWGAEKSFRSRTRGIRSEKSQ